MKTWFAEATVVDMVAMLRDEFYFDRVRKIAEFPGRVRFEVRLDGDLYWVEVKADLDFTLRPAPKKPKRLL